MPRLDIRACKAVLVVRGFHEDCRVFRQRASGALRKGTEGKAGCQKRKDDSQTAKSMRRPLMSNLELVPFSYLLGEGRKFPLMSAACILTLIRDKASSLEA